MNVRNDFFFFKNLKLSQLEENTASETWNTYIHA